MEIGANIFNSTDQSVDLSVEFHICDINGKKAVQKITLAAGASSFVAWDFTNIEECNSVRCTLPYSITVTGKNAVPLFS